MISSAAGSTGNNRGKRSRSFMTPGPSILAAAAFLLVIATAPSPNNRRGSVVVVHAFATPGGGGLVLGPTRPSSSSSTSTTGLRMAYRDDPRKTKLEKSVATICTTLGISLGMCALLITTPLSNSAAHAEDELYAKYGNRGLDASLLDRDCLVDKCALQARACLRDDPSCRKGLTCTAKCLGDNSCITGCFAKYGTPNLDSLLKCTIEDNDCIKIAILDGGTDVSGDEPRSIAPTIRNFDMASLEGTWYKVVGYNPNYDCYACQRNTFSSPQRSNDETPPVGGLLGHAFSKLSSADRLQVNVEFSMPRMNDESLLLEDGSPIPPISGIRETYTANDGSGSGGGLQSVGYNAYSTHETMIFDNSHTSSNLQNVLTLGRGTNDEKLYSRTAHSEGEMFGLKFWENWYIIGQNDPGDTNEFKFIYYNGKTRQNTYDGAFVYSRSRTLSPTSMEKVYKIAKDAGMNPDQFCKIHNGCFESPPGGSSGNSDDTTTTTTKSEIGAEPRGQENGVFRGILASTKVSEILGVESVAAETVTPKMTIARELLVGGGPSPTTMVTSTRNNRPWWKEMGDYLEDPRRHFRLMDSLREDMDWPDYIKARN